MIQRRPILLAYASQQPYSIHNICRFGLKDWGPNFDILAIDVTAMISPAVGFQQGCEKDLTPSDIKLVRVRTLFDLKALNKYMLKSPESLYYIDLLGDTYKALMTKLYLRYLGFKRVTVSFGALPIPWDALKKERMQRWFGGMLRMNPHVWICLIQRLTEKLICKAVEVIVPPSLSLITGTSAEKEPRGVRRLESQVLTSRTLDFELYLEYKYESVDQAFENTIVYVDTGLVEHPDLLYDANILACLGTGPSAGDIQSYYRCLKEKLATLAREHDLRVIIAAHPRSSRYFGEIEKLFDGFEVVIGKTACLISRSSVVAVDCSTAIGLAVLFEKPMVFFTGKVWRRSIEYEGLILRASSILARPVIDAEADVDSAAIDVLAPIDKVRYGEYVTRYISHPESKNMSCWKALEEAILKRSN